MVFERKVQLNYDNLTESTKLRFMELEIQAAIEALQTSLFSFCQYPNIEAKKAIANAIVANPSKEMLRDDLLNAFGTLKFRKPTKDEKIHYFRYKRIGVAKVAKYARVAPNTVQELKDQHPNFTPVFNGWLGFTGLVKNWENLKNTINFFNDDLIQAKDNHLLHLNIVTTETEEETEVAASMPPEDITVKPKEQRFDDPDIDRSQWVWVRDAKMWMPKYDEYGNENMYF